MEMLLVIGGIGVALSTAIVVVVVRALRRSQRESTLRGAEHTDIGSRKDVTTLERTAEEAERLSAEEEARRRAEKAARIAAEKDAQRETEAARGRAEEARVAAEQEVQWQAEETRRRAEESARVTAEQEAQRLAEEARRRRVEEEARAAAEREAQLQAEEAHRRVEQEALVAAEQQAQRQAEEARRRAEEEARVAAEGEAQREAEEARRRRVEEEAPVATPQEDKSPRIEKQEDGRRTPLRAPRQYRPAARVSAGPPGPAPATTERDARDRAMPIEVRLVFEKAGFCRVSLLPRRASGMPVEFAVTGSGNPPELLALQDEWYQDVVLANLERLLRDGIEWAGALPEGRSVRLSLSGRELYALARHGELNGFVSAPRLILGEDHVVLCVAERLPEVRAAIALTGSPEPTLLNSDSGVPGGWAGLRGVLPRRPIAPSSDGDILDALRPLAEVEIALEGGIRIERQTWLSGFPPSIRLRGDTSTIGVVTIDGRNATLSQDGSYAAPGWDALGDHNLWCTSGSRTYAIREGAKNWEPWDAYTWSLGEPAADRGEPRPVICGVLVRPPRVARSDGRAIVVTASNPVLIGANPGEIEFCAPRGDVRAGQCVGFPWFEPVWAIPADALHCDKRTARVLLIGPPQPESKGDQQAGKRHGGQVSRHRARSRGTHAWCTAILTAGRKGLQTEPSRGEIADLWKTYKRCAKALWKSMR